MDCVRCLYVIVYVSVCIPRHVSSQRPIPLPQVRTIDNVGQVHLPNQYASNVQHLQAPHLQHPVPNPYAMNVQHIVPNHPTNLQSVPNQVPIVNNVPNQYPIVHNVPNQYPANVQQQHTLPHQHLFHHSQDLKGGVIGSLLHLPQKVLGNMAPRVHKRKVSYEWRYVTEAVSIAGNKLFDSNGISYGYNTQDRHYYVVVIDVILRVSSEVYWQTQKNYEDQSEIYRKIYEETARNVVMDSMVNNNDDTNSRMQYYFQNYIQLIKMLEDFKGSNQGTVSQYIINLKSQLSTISMLFLEISSKLDQVISSNVPLSYILDNPDILQEITLAIVDLEKDFNSFYIRNSYLNLSYEEHVIVQLLFKISTGIFKPQMVNSYNRMLSLVDNSKMVDHLYYHSLKHKNSEGYVTDHDNGQYVYSNSRNKYPASGTIIVYVLDKSKANQFENIANSGNKQIINEKLLKQYLNNPNYKRVILIKDKTEANLITSPNKEWLDVLQGKKVLIDDVYSINCDVRPIDTTTQNYNDDIDIKICAHFKKSSLEHPVSIADIHPNGNCNLTWPNNKTPWNVEINTESPEVTFGYMPTRPPTRPRPVLPARTTSCQQIWIDGVNTQSCDQSLNEYTSTENPWSIGWTPIDPRPKSPWTKEIISPKPSCQPIWVDGVITYEPCQTQERTTRSIWDIKSNEYITTDSPWPKKWTQSFAPTRSPWNEIQTSKTNENIPTDSPWPIRWTQMSSPTRSPWNEIQTSKSNENIPTDSPWPIRWTQMSSPSRSPWNEIQTSKSNENIPTDSPWPIKWTQISSPTRPPWNEIQTLKPNNIPRDSPRPIKWTQISSPTRPPWNEIPEFITTPPCQPQWIDGVIIEQPCITQDLTTRSYDFPTTESPWPVSWALNTKTESPWRKPQTYPIWTDSKSEDMNPTSLSSWPNRWITPKPITNNWNIKWSDITPSTDDWIYTKPTTESNWDKISEDVSPTQTPWRIQWISQDPTRDINWNYPTPQSNTDSRPMEIITSTQLPWPTLKYITRIPNSPRPMPIRTSTEPTRETRWKVPSSPFWPSIPIKTQSPKINWYTNKPTVNTEWNIKWQEPTTEVDWNREPILPSTNSPNSFQTFNFPSWPINPNNTQSWNYKWDIRDQTTPTWHVKWLTSEPVTFTPPSIKWEHITPQTDYPWKIKWTEPNTLAPPSWSMKWDDYEPISKVTLPPPQPITWLSFKPITETNLPSAETIKWENDNPTWQQSYDPTTWNYKWLDVEPTTTSQNIKWIDVERTTPSPIATQWEYVPPKTSPWSVKWIYENPTTESWQPRWTYQEPTTPRQNIWYTRKPPLYPWSILSGGNDASTEPAWNDLYPSTEVYRDREVDTELPWDIFWTQDLPKQTSPQPINWKTNGVGNIMWIGEIKGIPNEFDLNSHSINELLRMNCYNYNDYISPISENHNFNGNRQETSAYILIYKERIYFILRNKKDHQYQRVSNNGCQMKDITCDVKIPPCIKLNKLYMKNVTIQSNAANYFGPLINQINDNALPNVNSCHRETDYPDWVEQHFKPILENNNQVKQILYPNSVSIKPTIGWKYVPNMKEDHPFSLNSCYSSNCLKNFMYCANGTCFWNSIKCNRGNCEYGVVRCVGATCYKSKKQCNVNDCIKHFNQYADSCLSNESSLPTQDDTILPHSRWTRSRNSNHCVGRFCFARHNRKPYIFHRK